MVGVLKYYSINIRRFANKVSVVQSRFSGTHATIEVIFSSKGGALAKLLVIFRAFGGYATAASADFRLSRKGVFIGVGC